MRVPGRDRIAVRRSLVSYSIRESHLDFLLDFADFNELYAENVSRGTFAGKSNVTRAAA